MPPVLVTACRGHAPWTPWYTCFIPVLVLIFNPSSLTHLSSHGTALTAASAVPWWWLQPFHTHFSYTGIFSSQFWCTSFIWIINLILKPALIPQHSLRSAMPCQGQAPGAPSRHFLFLFWYTSLISLLLLMFYLFKLSSFHFSLHQWYGTRCAQPACQGQAPWTSQSTCLIPVLTVILF